MPIQHVRECKSLQDFSVRPHSHSSQKHWKLLFSCICLPPYSFHRCSKNLLTSGASRVASARAGWAEAHGRVCIGKGNRKCWAVKEQGTHATGSSETKTRTVAGLRVCPAILCLDKGVQNLRLWEQTSGLGSPVLHTQPHCSGGRSPLRAGRAK